VYTTAQPPLLACAVRTALTLIRDDVTRRERLQASIARFRGSAGPLPWRLMPSTTAIQPLLVGDANAAVELSQRLADRGFWVPAIRPPTVPAGTARLRVSLSAAHTNDDIEGLGGGLAECSPCRCTSKASAKARRSCCCMDSRCMAASSRRSSTRS